MGNLIISEKYYCNQTLYSFVHNLTSSFADQRNEASMVATSVVMFAVATLFFNLNLFSDLSDISAILNPSVRFFLSGSLSLFLPVMFYLFSEAKNAAAASGWTTTTDELSLRAGTILLWMLLVELLRKKVEAIMVSAGVPGYPGTVERAARIGWLGYLVFYNLRSAGKKALYGALWVLAAAKLVQRLVTLELGKRSFAYGKNPELVASYMVQILQEEEDEQLQVGSNNNNIVGSELLKRCNYVVMTWCVLGRITESPSPTNHFSAVDIFITILLFLAFAYEVVARCSCSPTGSSCPCSAATPPPPASLARWSVLSWVIRGILWVRGTLSRPSVSFKQFSVLCSFRRLPLFLQPTKAVPREAKKAIMERMANAANNPLSNGSWSDEGV